MRTGLAARVARLEKAANPAQRYAFVPYDVTERGREAIEQWQAAFLRDVSPATTVIFYQWRGPEPVPEIPGGFNAR